MTYLYNWTPPLFVDDANAAFCLHFSRYGFPEFIEPLRKCELRKYGKYEERKLNVRPKSRTKREEMKMKKTWRYFVLIAIFSFRRVAAVHRVRVRSRLMRLKNFPNFPKRKRRRNRRWDTYGFFRGKSFRFAVLVAHCRLQASGAAARTRVLYATVCPDIYL